MAGSLHVRKVDDEIIRSLKQRAALHGRSAEAEHREILRAALGGGKIDRETWGKRAAALRASIGDRPQTPSEVLLRESRDER